MGFKSRGAEPLVPTWWNDDDGNFRPDYQENLPPLPDEVIERIRTEISADQLSESVLLWFRHCYFCLECFHRREIRLKAEKQTLRDAADYIHQQGSQPRGLLRFVDQRLDTIVDETKELLAVLEDGQSGHAERVIDILKQAEQLRQDLELIGPDMDTRGGGQVMQVRLGESGQVDFIYSAFAGISKNGAARIVISMRHAILKRHGEFDLSSEIPEQQRFSLDVEALNRRRREIERALAK